MRQMRKLQILFILVLVFVALGSYTLLAWTPLPVEDDPLVRMPGSQPGQVTLESPNRCLNCHSGYDQAVEPGWNWQGSMMAQSARDFVFWACLTVAGQDSIWAIGRPNAVDICERCHFPKGWLEGRSDPPNASLMTGVDYDGVQCDFCHNLYDPFFQTTHDGTREGSDWTGYWDETNDSETPSQPAADATYTEDASLALAITLFNGGDFYDSNLPFSSSYTENGGGQYFVSPNGEKRASFADANGRHAMLYSRYHKSRYFCSTCHDVSNPALANLEDDPSQPLTSETQSAHSYFHVERTFSEFMLSDYGQQGGSAGLGPYAPDVFETSHPGNYVASCQDCHMPDGVGIGGDMNNAVLRPTDSTEHPESGQPVHDLTGGNAWVSYVLASASPGSPNYDATNEQLLDQGPASLTLDLSQGVGFDADALLAGAQRAQQQLLQAADIQNLAYDPGSGALSFRVQNRTGHKLISGFPEGRRMFVNVKIYSGGSLIYEVNPYDPTAATLKGLPPDYSPNSPPLGPNESYVDELVYEMHPSSTLTGEEETFHFALATGRYKDNRIPPKGFRVAEAAARLSEPVWHGVSDPDYFTTAEYGGGYDDVSLIDYGLSLPGADHVRVTLYYQTTSREYIEFLRDEINGTGNLTLPTTPGVPGPPDPASYIIQTDPFFDQLRAWGDTIWQLWDHNKGVEGAAPFEMSYADHIVPSLPEIRFESGSYRAGEIETSATITVSLSGTSEVTATVDYATADGTAVAPDDYAAASGTLTFTPGVTVQSFPVYMQDDELFEGDETVALSLSNPVSATVGTGAAELTIVDDETMPTLSVADAEGTEDGGPLTFAVSLSGPSAFAVSVDYDTADGTAVAPDDYAADSGTVDISPGATTGEIAVSPQDDAVYEGDETFQVTLSNPSGATVSDGQATGTILDDETAPQISFSLATYEAPEAAGTASITVTLTGETVFTATVDYETGGGTATAGDDYVSASGTLTFTPGTTEQAFPIMILDDSEDELDETVDLWLTGTTSATLDLDSAYLLILDDEGEPSLSIRDAEADETSGTMTFAVDLSFASASAVSVDYDTADGTAVAPGDYAAVTGGTLTILAGETTGYITIDLEDDLVYEGDETFQVTLSNPSGATVTDGVATGTILEDDPVPELSFESGGYQVGEVAGSATITVVLSGTTALTATVEYATTDGSAQAGADYLAATGTLTFTPGITLQTFLVPIQDDGLFEGDEALALSLSNPASATVVAGTAELLILDDDTAPELSFEPTSYAAVETEASATITVALSGETALTATVEYMTADAGAEAGSDYLAASGTLIFTPGVTAQTFAVSILDDELIEGDEAISLSLSSPVSATVGTGSADLVILDDDEVTFQIYMPLILRGGASSAAAPAVHRPGSAMPSSLARRR
jgi:hypothetical protein